MTEDIIGLRWTTIIFSIILYRQLHREIDLKSSNDIGKSIFGIKTLKFTLMLLKHLLEIQISYIRRISVSMMSKKSLKKSSFHSSWLEILSLLKLYIIANNSSLEISWKRSRLSSSSIIRGKKEISFKTSAILTCGGSLNKLLKWSTPREYRFENPCTLLP